MLRSVGPIAFASLVVVACGKTPSEPAPSSSDPKPAASATASAATSTTTTAASAATSAPSDTSAAPAGSSAVVQKGGNDPLAGKFTLADATKGLEGKGALTAKIDTDKGPITCKLLEDKAPNTVANFVGLARGVRPFQDPKPGPTVGDWVKRPAYDGTTFHRIIKGFMIQGGDPKGTGTGEPGYTIKDELWPGSKHDKVGLLCMANRGHDTNGMQFFITDAAAAHLDNNYTIFGECSPDQTIHDLASVPVKGDRPDSPPAIKTVTITRGGGGK